MAYITRFAHGDWLNLRSWWSSRLVADEHVPWRHSTDAREKFRLDIHKMEGTDQFWPYSRIVLAEQSFLNALSYHLISRKIVNIGIFTLVAVLQSVSHFYYIFPLECSDKEVDNNSFLRSQRLKKSSQQRFRSVLSAFADEKADHIQGVEKSTALLFSLISHITCL